MRPNELTKFTVFCKDNPFNFTMEQFSKVKEDIINPRTGVVSDEYVDFILWTRGLKSRQEYFAEYIEKMLSLKQYRRLLEVGCGRNARLAKMLSAKGYKMTVIDPMVIMDSSDNISYIKSRFCFDKTDISGYDAIVAQEPCEATEHIIRACIGEKKDFIISLCGAAHRQMNGEMPDDVYQWYNYLEEIGDGKCTLIRPSIIPGYICSVMMGILP